MRIITLTKDEFDNFSNRHSFNTFYQSSNYADFAKINDEYNTHYLGFVDSNDNLIGASLMLYKTLFWGYKCAYAPRGFLFKYDNDESIEDLVVSLKRLLHKQKFIFITIDPPIVASERDKGGNTIQFNNGVNHILNVFKRNNFEHLGFNLYNESKLSRWNVIAKLNQDSRIIYNNFSNDVKEKITHANNMAITVSEDTTRNITDFLDYLKKIGMKKNLKYYHNLFNAFDKNRKAKIFYAKINTKKYTQSANTLYAKEEEKNKALASIIQSGNREKYNIQKAINDKIASDKLLHMYKKDIVNSTKLLKNFPDGITCGAALTIEESRGVNIIVNAVDKNYEESNIAQLLNYEIMKYFGKANYQYINLGAITGNFDRNSKYYPILETKLGFNSSVIEYIGEFNIILNPMMYKIYKKKYKL